ncbi:unnamed protein product [Rhizoctonia solani]|uniref:Uncharacterized protein n=1 Tax=Rhizoctonia solani TaxID=456999 RepID=A0A8H3I2W7_9AGAM|nr:unnamed protein product [Rhizoctonia solani]
MFSRLFSSRPTQQTSAPSSKDTSTVPSAPSTSHNAPSSTQGQGTSRFVWDVLSILPPGLQHTGAQVVAFCSDYITHDEKKGVQSLNWIDFKDAIDNLETVDLVMEGFASEPLARAPVVHLPSAFAKPLINKLKMPIGQEDTTLFIKEVVDRLDWAKQDGVASFYVIPADPTMKTKAESVWEYRLLMMAPNPKVADDFYAQAAVLEVRAHTEHESDWAPIKDDLHATSVKLTIMKLAANKGFRRPVPISPHANA